MKAKLLSVKEYDLMIENGILTIDDRIELLNGTIVEKTKKSPPHCASTDIVMKLFFGVFDEKAVVRNQSPIWLDEYSEPEPDIVLAMSRDDEYENSNPRPEEVYLILEVADLTLKYDRTIKADAYSRAGIQQYLILNVLEKTLEDYREPNADGFQSKQTHRAGQNFNLVAFPEISLQVDDFLPN